MRPLPDELLQHPAIWRVGDRPRLVTSGIPSGFIDLDRELPDRGWPRAALTELLCDAVGIGEVSLLLPAMASEGVRSKGVIWIAPPYLPYAPALAAARIDLGKLLIARPATATDTLWAAEQAMRAGAAAMVVVWLSQSVEYALLRRLQLACSTAECAGFIYRASSAARQVSPAMLRLLLTQALAIEQSSLTLQILKRRGMHAAQPLSLTTATTSTSLRGTKQSRFSSYEIATP